MVVSPGPRPNIHAKPGMIMRPDAIEQAGIRRIARQPRSLAPMAITLTDAAAHRARDFLGSRPDAVGLRFGVRKTGCSGWGYEIDIASEVGPDDRVFEQDGVRVVVDAQSLSLVDGTE